MSCLQRFEAVETAPTWFELAGRAAVASHPALQFGVTGRSPKFIHTGNIVIDLRETVGGWVDRADIGDLDAIVTEFLGDLAKNA
jgi:hypothetical protein